MLFELVAVTSQAVAATSKRTEKVSALAALLGDAAPTEISSVVAYAMGETPIGRIGVGWATIANVAPQPATTPTLTIADIDRLVATLATTTGVGSVGRRRDLLHDALARATLAEQGLLRSIIGGELRQGALDGVMTAAVAKAAGVTVDEVRRAAMYAGSLPVAAAVALTGGSAALAAIELNPSTPIQPMLASPATDVADAMAATGLASVEYKLDGARIQAHRRGGEVALFTRNLNEVSDRLPSVVAVVRDLPGGDLVLDGEVLGVDDAGAPRRFQDTIGDFASETGADNNANDNTTNEAGTPGNAGLQPFFFDVLYADTSLVDEPLAARREILHRAVPAAHRLPSIVTETPDEAQAFLDASLAAGHEGVVIKALDATYDAGRRGGAWRKVKPVYTLDLVVLAAEWGHGRRQGWLSNLHLGARGDDNSFVMVGKTFKGLTDELLAWQTARFLDLKIGEGTGRDGHVVYVRPEQVVEIAVDGVQVSTRYPGGVALRFARVRRYRDDKPASQADTIEAVQALLR